MDKKQADPRSVGLYFRVTGEERKMIDERMKEAGMKNMRAFVMNQVRTGMVVNLELESVKEMNRLLSNATNNINQIARRANETGSIHAADMAMIRKRQDGIIAQQKEILKRLAAIC